MPPPRDEPPDPSARPHRPAARLRRGIASLSRVSTVLWLGALFVTYAIGYAAGLLARAAHLPLAFVLGPLLTTAVLGIASLNVQGVRRIRPAAQFVIGSAIGVQFTRAIVIKLVVLLPLIVGSALVTIAVCAIAAVLLMRIAQLDRKTAFFATAPAGAAEMANIAARHGGIPEPIMVSQTMRIVLVVVTAPFIVIHFADDGQAHEIVQTAVMSPTAMLLLALCAGAGGWLISRTAFPNAWFVGPLVAAAIAGATGLVEGRLPDPLLTFAQVLIGCSLGAQFRREFVTRLLPQLLASTVVVLFAMIAMGAIAALCAYLFSLSVPTMVLALAPAGMAEMTLTGKVLGLDAAMISGFHIVRIILVLLLCIPAFRLFDRLVR
jgi:membrane AbrB-like protein